MVVEDIGVGSIIGEYGGEVITTKQMQVRSQYIGIDFSWQLVVVYAQLCGQHHLLYAEPQEKRERLHCPT